VQDFALESAGIEEIRADLTMRRDVTLTIDSLSAGTWTVNPYDTWTGDWFEAVTIECPGGPCEISLPEFHADLALHLER